MLHFGSTKWIVLAYSTGIYKCSGSPISLGPGEISPPSPSQYYDYTHAMCPDSFRFQFIAVCLLFVGSALLTACTLHIIHRNV